MLFFLCLSDNINDSVDDMDVDVSPMSAKSIKSGIDRMLELGRELLQMSLRLEKKYQNVNDEIVAQNRKMMEVKKIKHHLYVYVHAIRFVYFF